MVCHGGKRNDVLDVLRLTHIYRQLLTNLGPDALPRNNYTAMRANVIFRPAEQVTSKSRKLKRTHQVIGEKTYNDGKLRKAVEDFRVEYAPGPSQ
jgi:hypothetical protein